MDCGAIISNIVACFALIVGIIQLRISFRPVVVLRVHAYKSLTVLEIKNIGTLGAENVVVKFKKEDLQFVANKANNETTKLHMQYLADLHHHFLQIPPNEGLKYFLITQSDRGQFADGPIMLRGEVVYRGCGIIRKKKKFSIDVSGNGCLTYEEWPGTSVKKEYPDAE